MTHFIQIKSILAHILSNYNKATLRDSFRPFDKKLRDMRVLSLFISLCSAAGDYGPCDNCKWDQETVEMLVFKVSGIDVQAWIDGKMFHTKFYYYLRNLSRYQYLDCFSFTTKRIQEQGSLLRSRLRFDLDRLLSIEVSSL